MFKTKRAAREAGYYSESELLKSKVVNRPDAEPTIVKGERFFGPDQCEPVLSRTEARRQGLTVLKDAVPAGQLCHSVGRIGSYGLMEYDVFRKSDTRPFTRPVPKPAVGVDLLAAIFAVNKSAKRYRDLAQKHYRGKRHGFAGNARERKELLYALKDRGIVEAVRQGRLEFKGVHGGLALYRGEGYCFHSTMAPPETVVDESEPVFIESRPRESREVRLKDAQHTLETLAADFTGFVSLEPAKRVRVTQPRTVPVYEEMDDYEQTHEQ